MGLRDNFLEIAELSIRWRGHSLVFSGNKGLIACGKLDDKEGIQIISSVQLNNNYHYYPVIIEIERSHGWISASLLKGSFELQMNGRPLTKSPLLIKELSFMMPPQTSELFEIFICETLPQLNVSQKRISLDHKAFKDQECYADYGILSANNELTQLIDGYSFGALKIDITDGECWVFAEDGVLFVNGNQCNHAQLFVNDIIQWQSTQWKIVGHSQLQRIDDISHDVCLEVNEDSQAEELKSHQGFLSFVGHAQVQSIIDVTEEELNTFRVKIHQWLKDADTVSPVEPAKVETSSMNVLSTAQTATDSQLALLRLGRRTSIWRELQSYSQDKPLEAKKVELTLPRPKSSYWHHAVIVSASICGGALLATLVGILFLM